MDSGIPDESEGEGDTEGIANEWCGERLLQRLSARPACRVCKSNLEKQSNTKRKTTGRHISRSRRVLEATGYGYYSATRGKQEAPISCDRVASRRVASGRIENRLCVRSLI